MSRNKGGIECFTALLIRNSLQPRLFIRNSRQMSIIARSSFTAAKGLAWYPGHQIKSLKQLENGLGHVDLVIEVRDARIPVSSTNPAFNAVLGERPRLIVFNKADLASPFLKKSIVDAYKTHRNEHVVFTSANDGKSVKSILNHAIGKFISSYSSTASWLIDRLS